MTTVAAAGPVLTAPRPVTPISILASRLQQLDRAINARGDVDTAIKAELRNLCELAAGLDPYLGQCTTAQSPALQLLDQRTAAADWTKRSPTAVYLEQEMISGHVEGQLLKMLVHATRARRVLEIGMFTGYSALAMAEALPADGLVITCEIDPDVADFARQCFDESAHGRKIQIELGPALSTLEELAADGQVFDLVFVDADKAGYLGYVNLLLETSLLAPGSLICADNTLLQGQPWMPGESTANGRAIAEFNQAIADDPRLEQVLIPLRDGLTLIRPTTAG